MIVPTGDAFSIAVHDGSLGEPSASEGVPSYPACIWYTSIYRSGTGDHHF